MRFVENEVVELKETVNIDFKKEIIAFANTNGGTIYVGIADDGEVVGVENIEKEMEKISNLIRDGIKPDLFAYTSIERVKYGQKEVLKVNVFRGDKRPYHLSDKGLKPSGVYVRHGISSVPASDEMIRQMLRESDGTTFDKARSMKQDLTFTFTQSLFEKNHLSFSSSNQRTLHLVNEDGYYTNAALLLSDQCEHSIKCAIYNGTNKTTFQARKEFEGSILKQIEDVYEYISLINKTSSTFDGLHRIDTKDYPEYAVREALLNAVVHRDYDYSGSIIINVYDDRMEFVSIGGLVKGITLEDAMNGISQSRNSILASIFYRLELIESYGTGIKRIMECYREQSVKPGFVCGPTSFVVTLPNINHLNKIQERNVSDEQKVLNLFEGMGFVARRDIERLLQVSSFPANKIINQLLDENKIQKVGSGRTTRYKLKK